MREGRRRKNGGGVEAVRRGKRRMQDTRSERREEREGQRWAESQNIWERKPGGKKSNDSQRKEQIYLRQAGRHRRRLYGELLDRYCQASD